MLLAPFLWIFCEFDEKVLDNLSLEILQSMLLNYKMATALKQYALKEGLAIRYALALWSVVRWGVFSVHQEKMDLFAIFHQLK